MKKKLCLVLADYYDDITELLVKGATEEILQAESKGIIKKLYGDSPHDMFFHVPGVFEIPVTISKLINKYDAFVVLGCIIKGQTSHFNYLCSSPIIEQSILGKFNLLFSPEFNSEKGFLA